MVPNAPQTARDIPERGSEHDAEEQVRGRGQQRLERLRQPRTGADQKRCSGDEVVERRAVLIVTVANAEMASPSRGRHAGGSLGTQRFGGSRDGAALPLFESLVDAQSLVGVRDRGMQRL